MTAGRPREFDMEQVLEAAMDVFWQKGYADTSMADLMAATGLAKGSVYKAFKDKHDLFMKALTAYLEGNYARVKNGMETAATAEKGVRSWIDAVLEMCNNQGVRKGCFAVNTLVELGPHDMSVASVLKQHSALMEKMLAQCIERGQKNGEFRRDKPAAHLAEALFAFVAGMMSFSKVDLSKARFKRLGEFALEILK